jgi:uncharacterized protein YutE (UPF0331/DUF86 family)
MTKRGALHSVTRFAIVLTSCLMCADDAKSEQPEDPEGALNMLKENQVLAKWLQHYTS